MRCPFQAVFRDTGREKRRKETTARAESERRKEEREKGGGWSLRVATREKEKESYLALFIVPLPRKSTYSKTTHMTTVKSAVPAR